MKIIRDFINSKYFILLTYLITLICWLLEIQTPAVIYSAVAIILIILSNAKRINIVTVIFALIINYRNTSYEDNLWLFLIAIGILIPFLLYDLYQHGFKYKNSIFIAMIFYLFSNIISMVNLTTETLNYGLVGVAQVLGFCFLFLYIWNIKEKDDFRYIAKTATCLSLVISIQVLIFLFRYDGEVLNKDIVLGWSATNSLAMTYLLLIPMTIYLYVEDQRRLYLIPILILDFGVIILTFCKGAYLTILLLFIPLIISIYRFIEDKKRFKKNLLLMMALVLLFVLLLFSITPIREGFINYFSKMNERGWFNDQARIGILKYGGEVFKKFPLFGSGSYTAKPYLIMNNYSANLKHYHNFIIQNLATLGIFGLITFGNYLLQIIKSSREKHFYNIAVLFSLFSMLIHGLVDNTLHNPVIFAILTIYLTCIIQKEKKID